MRSFCLYELYTNKDNAALVNQPDKQTTSRVSLQGTNDEITISNKQVVSTDHDCSYDGGYQCIGNRSKSKC